MRAPRKRAQVRLVARRLSERGKASQDPAITRVAQAMAYALDWTLEGDWTAESLDELADQLAALVRSELARCGGPGGAT